MKLFQKEKRLAILDIDGVILDIGGLRRNFARVARKFHLPVSPFLAHWMKVKAGTQKAWPDISSAMKAFWDIDDPELVKSFGQSLFEREKEKPHPLIEGTVEAITLLQNHGIELALCTSRPAMAVEPILEIAGLDVDHFSAISTKDSGYSKPDPRVFDSIFTKVDVNKDLAFFVGDFETDFEAANSAGIDFAAVLSGIVVKKSFLQAGVPKDRIFKNLHQLVKTNILF